MTMECIVFIWLCKYIKKVKRIQAAILLLNWANFLVTTCFLENMSKWEMILTLNKQVSQFYFPKINRKNTKTLLKDNGNV